MLPRDLRPRYFAMAELYLDLTYAIEQTMRVDWDSTLIIVCVTEATMRPVVLDSKTPAEVRRATVPPEEYRGSISRLQIADRTGLARETVRRKVAALLASGHLVKDANGRIRTPPRLTHPLAKKLADDAFAAVQRYDTRLRKLGAKGIRSGSSSKS